MKKIFKILVVACLATLSVTPLVAQETEKPKAPLEIPQQVDTALQLKRVRGHFVGLSPDMPSSRVSLREEQLRQLLASEQFKAYKKARRQYINSMVLLPIGSAWMLGASYLLGNYIKNDIYVKDIGYVPYGVGFYELHLDFGLMYVFIGLAFIVPGVVLHVMSKNKLNKIALDYNTLHGSRAGSDISLKFGTVHGGIGMQVNF